jgi:aflatoxin B1 aldehyde reductase
MKIILGTMTIDYDYVSNESSILDYQNIIQNYIDKVEDPILDTAYYYGNTKTEQTLGKILPNLSSIPKIATKANPWYENDFTTNKLGQLSKDNLRFQLETSLKNLNIPKVDIFYLHCPDYETPILETLESANDLHRMDKFDSFGISNFSLQQLEEVLLLCEENGFVMPQYYQGMYNLLCRKVEEVFPILNKKGVNFWGYNPLAGGLLTGKYINQNLDTTLNSRFKNNKIYQNIFYKPEILDSVDKINSNCENNILNHSLSWFNNNKNIKDNDGLIIGVSNLNQLENNIGILSSNKKFNYESSDEIYKLISTITPNYYY